MNTATEGLRALPLVALCVAGAFAAMMLLAGCGSRKSDYPEFNLTDSSTSGSSTGWHWDR